MKAKFLLMMSSALFLITACGSASSAIEMNSEISIEKNIPDEAMFSSAETDDVQLSVQLSETPFHEVKSRAIGPLSKHPMRAFNINHFEFQKASKTVPDCEELAKKNPCPREMVFVCSKFFRTATCVDRDLHVDRRTGKPQGNMNLADCEDACKSQDKRLPTNNEWQVACTGTKPEACLTYKGEYPPLRYSKVPGHVCQRTGPYNDPCMTSPDLVALLPTVPRACASEAGVRGCVGTFEQWVSHAFVAHQFYRFNGGMYALDASAVNYVTPAHSNSYRHYAGGCRCASDPR